MAARVEAVPDAESSGLVDLRQLPATCLDALLHEEIDSWRSALDWDFGKSADLVRRFVDLRALNGAALVRGGDCIGYSYYVLEDHKGLVGDLYVRRAAHSAEAEHRLLSAVLDAMIGAPGITRIESQLMMLDAAVHRSLPLARFSESFERSFMQADFAAMPQLFPGKARRKLNFERWTESHQEAAAQLIAAAYVGHIDSRINDQYRSAAGARRFLYNIVQYPGCGTFFRPGSLVAFDALTARMLGISLASMVGPQAGHITQICVTPSAKGAGVGYELLRQTLAALRDAGCTHASLTVTSSNREAVKLYERVGFSIARRFRALVWEGF